MEGFSFISIALLVLAMVIVIRGLRIVKQSEALVVERLGRYRTTMTAGINILIPFVDRPRASVWRYAKEGPMGERVVAYKMLERIDMRETVFDFPRQSVITRDNVVTEINALIYFQITDPVKSVYEISNLPNAIEKLTQTTLRNVLGELDLDECLSSRDTINTKLRAILDEATNKWGVKVNRVELQDINPPQDIKEAMEKQMRAERSRRAQIIEAEGTKALFWPNMPFSTLFLARKCRSIPPRYAVQCSLLARYAVQYSIFSTEMPFNTPKYFIKYFCMCWIFRPGG